MLASHLDIREFDSYPPKARALSLQYLDLFRRCPTLFVAVMLREVIHYDWKFPAEQGRLQRHLQYLQFLSPGTLQTLLAPFAQIRLDSHMQQVPWVKEPFLFSERLTAYLWSTHQIDAFRIAATDYTLNVERALPPAVPPIPRLAIAVIGRGAEQQSTPLFRKLRPYGVHFTQVDPQNGLDILTEAIAARAAAHPLPYQHWLIDGDQITITTPHLACISYQSLQLVRTALLAKMREVIQSGNGGPELLETTMARITPQELGMDLDKRDEVLDHFQVSVLTLGAGTQIFSTTFVQWAAREALSRAEPLTLFARFTPRQRQRPMNELLDDEGNTPSLDPQGSLLDADMGSYYIWLDQQRLTGAENSSFLVWFEDHQQALAVGPGLSRGTTSAHRATLKQLLQWIS